MEPRRKRLFCFSVNVHNNRQAIVRHNLIDFVDVDFQVIVVAPCDKAQCSVLCINSLYASWQHGVQWLALSPQSKKVVGLNPAGAVAILSGVACSLMLAWVSFTIKFLVPFLFIFLVF